MSMRQARVAVAGMMMAALAWAAPAVAQTNPKVTEHPASAIFIGNSFFYYNNGIHSHFTGCCAPPSRPRISAPPR